MQKRYLKTENSPRFRGGFTLIELLVVIFIIAVLTGIILPNFVGSRQRARDARRKQDLADIKNALRMYYNDNQSYPDQLYNVSFSETYLTSEYIQPVPRDPTGGTYNYCVSADGDKFVLMAEMENLGDREAVENQDDSGCPSSLCDLVCSADKCYYVCGN